MILKISRRARRALLLAVVVAATVTLGGCVVAPGYYGHGYDHHGWGWHHHDDWR